MRLSFLIITILDTKVFLKNKTPINYKLIENRTTFYIFINVRVLRQEYSHLLIDIVLITNIGM